MRKWWPLVAICLGAFMLLIDVTIVTVALPDMARDLGASFTELQWVIDIYALSLAALLLGAGSVADRLGRRKVYLVGMALFAVASLACGLAPNAGVLIAARALQGIGGAAMFATTMALLNATYSGRDRGIAFGMWGAVNGAAAAAGPVLGGLLTEHLGWRSIFLVNLPVSVVAIALTLAVVAESRRPSTTGLDVGGLLSFTVAAGALTYALIRAGDTGFADTGTLLLFALAAVAVVVFVVAERSHTEPMLDLSLFRNASFTATLVGGLLLMASAFAMLAFTSVWLQSVLGLTPVAAGVALVPMAAASFLVSALAGRFLQDISPRWTVGAGLLLIAAGAALQGMLDSSSTALALLPGLVVTGIGVGVGLPTLSAAVMSAVPVERGGMAAGALNTARQLGYALGIAVLGLVFRDSLERGLDGGVPDPAAVTSAVTGGRAPDLDVVRTAVASGLNTGYLVAAGFGLVAGVIVLVWVRRPAPTAARSAPVAVTD